MSLREFTEIRQGSEEWHAVRRGLVTASVVGRLITPAQKRPAFNDTSRAITAQLVAERITEHTEPTFRNDDMDRGVFDEPFAREVYSDNFAAVSECGFMVRDGLRYESDEHDLSIGYSPDGLVGDDGLIEIKSRQPKRHVQHVLDDEVPAENVAQIQCALLVSGRKWCDYVSYCGGMALWVKRVEPDPEWHAAIVAAVAMFEFNAEVMIRDYRAATEGLPMTERFDVAFNDQIGASA